MKAPGGLVELDEAARLAWEAEVTGALQAAREQFGSRQLVTDEDVGTERHTLVDWVGLPARVIECATRTVALGILEQFPSDRTLQEEYVEWRTLRDEQGCLRRVELTTELREYWTVMAGHQPKLTLELVTDFAGEAGPAAVEQVYGGCDPFDPSTEPADRAEAFTATMLPPSGHSPYNDGQRSICCLTGKTNTLYALLRMVAAASHAKLTRDETTGRDRLLTSAEAIPLMDDVAQAGRASDPVLVERLMRLAYEQRLIALADPPGIYIQSVQHTRLRTPDGHEVPAHWFTFSRGTPADQHPDGLPRWQRLHLEVPADTGWTISDLIDIATEKPIRYGGQIAELVQVAVIFAVSEPGRASVREPATLLDVAVGELDCRDLPSESEPSQPSPSRRERREGRR